MVWRGLELLSSGRYPGVVCLYRAVCMHGEGPHADARYKDTFEMHAHALRLQTEVCGTCVSPTVRQLRSHLEALRPRLRACCSATCCAMQAVCWTTWAIIGLLVTLGLLVFNAFPDYDNQHSW